jgi:HAD superfamily hydrolase (TIGR01549 family)
VADGVDQESLERDDRSGRPEAHLRGYLEQQAQIHPLPGARELLQHLTDSGIPWAIATSGSQQNAGPALAMLDIPSGTAVVTRDEVPFAKPDPHLLVAAAGRLNVDVQNALVVGDSVWDMLAAQRARALGAGLLSEGHGREELERAGAFRVYNDAADLNEHLDELGIRFPSQG